MHWILVSILIGIGLMLAPLVFIVARAVLPLICLAIIGLAVWAIEICWPDLIAIPL
jgi:hypothetical protein